MHTRAPAVIPGSDVARWRWIALTCLVLAGCSTVQATSLPLPRERADECRAHCAGLDMELGAVVIMMNHAGCVCEPRGRVAPQAAVSAGAAAIAGAATVKAIEDEEEEAARHKRKH